MSCCLCTKKEKGADPNSIYICSTCTYKLGSMNRANVRTIIDTFYLNGRSEDAMFVEKLVFGCNNLSAEPPKMLKRTTKMKIRKRPI